MGSLLRSASLGLFGLLLLALAWEVYLGVRTRFETQNLLSRLGSGAGPGAGKVLKGAYKNPSSLNRSGAADRASIYGGHPCHNHTQHLWGG